MTRQGGGPAAGGACTRGLGLVGPFFLPVSAPGILCSAMQITRMLLIIVVPYGGGTLFGLDYLPLGSLCQPFGCQSAFESANLLVVLTPVLSEAVEFVLEVANLLLHIIGGSAHLAGGRP